jgi:hypothetical protein
LRDAVPNNGHDLPLAAERRDRVAIAQGFRVRDQVRFDAVIFLCTTIRNAEPGLDFVQDENTALLWFCG